MFFRNYRFVKQKNLRTTSVYADTLHGYHCFLAQHRDNIFRVEQIRIDCVCTRCEYSLRVPGTVGGGKGENKREEKKRKNRGGGRGGRRARKSPAGKTRVGPVERVAAVATVAVSGGGRRRRRRRRWRRGDRNGETRPGRPIDRFVRSSRVARAARLIIADVAHARTDTAARRRSRFPDTAAPPLPSSSRFV